MSALILQSVLVAVFAVVFSCILIAEGMLLEFWGRWMNKLPDKIGFPLGGCAYCFAGQVALWYYFFVEAYNVFNHVFFVSMTIFFTHLILYIYERTQGGNDDE